MNEEIKKELKETADVLKELIKSVVSIQKILTEQDK